MIPEEFKQRVREATDLVALVQEGGGPQLKRVGGAEWRGLCPFHKESTPSFTVNDHKQFFHCFGCAEHGDCFDWLMKQRGMGFMDALRDLAKRAGLTVPSDAGLGQRLYQPPEVKRAASTAADGGAAAPPYRDSGSGLAVPRRGLAAEKFRALQEGSAVWRYLTVERCVPGAVLREYRLVETHSKAVFYRDGAEDWQAVGFVYADPANVGRDGRARIEFVKCLNLEREVTQREDGTTKRTKVEWRNPESRRSILFGMDAVPAGVKELVICEGEMDALSWRAFGFWAVSVPSGAKSQGWIDVCSPWLERFERVHLSFDEDAVGRSVVAEIAVRLGIERTGMVRMPERAA